jgi:hypothetical protein
MIRLSRFSKASSIPVSKEGAKYVLKNEDIEEFQVLIDCITTLYSEEDENEGKAIRAEFSKFLNKKMTDLSSQVKSTMGIKMIQVLNLKTNFSVYQLSLFKTLSFIEKFVDKRLAMILRMAYNSMSNSFEGISDLLLDTLKNGTDPPLPQKIL